LSNGTGRAIVGRSNLPGYVNAGVIDGYTTVVGGNAVFGGATRPGAWGVFGLSDSSAGVAGIGYYQSSVGVYGQSYRGTSAQFVIDNSLANNSNTLEVSNSQSGKGINVNTGSGIGVYSNSNTSHAGRFENTNAANDSTTLQVLSNGTGRAIVGRSNLPGYVNAGVIDGFTTVVGGNAVFGGATRPGAWGVFGLSDSSAGVAGIAYYQGSVGVYGQSYRGTSAQFVIDNSLPNSSNAVEVSNSQSGNGVVVNVNNSADGIKINQSGNGIGLYANSNGGYAGYFDGDVYVTGILSKGGGSFKIDHPQDPQNKYLVHSFVESPDMMNVYNGNVVTDAAGKAIVDLPSYFDAENIDFKYQLTVIGQFAQAIIGEEIKNNQFVILTDKPNVKVSWQVTGVRNDKFAQKNRIQTEVEKTGVEKGRYINPELYGRPKEEGIAFLKSNIDKNPSKKILSQQESENEANRSIAQKVKQLANRQNVITQETNETIDRSQDKKDNLKQEGLESISEKTRRLRSTVNEIDKENKLPLPKAQSGILSDTTLSISAKTKKLVSVHNQQEEAISSGQKTKMDTTAPSMTEKTKRLVSSNKSEEKTTFSERRDKLDSTTTLPVSEKIKKLLSANQKQEEYESTEKTKQSGQQVDVKKLARPDVKLPKEQVKDPTGKQ
jgi:hypothetical protein